MEDFKSTALGITIVLGVAIARMAYNNAQRAHSPSSDSTYSQRYSMPFGQAATETDPAAAEAVQALEANSKIPSPPSNGMTFDDYLQYIQKDLGSEYGERYKYLKENYTGYNLQEFCLLVYAFNHGWRQGYLAELEIRARSRSAAQQIVNARHDEARRYFRAWNGANNICNLLDLEMEAGWKAGRRFGKNAGTGQSSEIPQPTPTDFQAFCHLPGAVNFDDLANSPTISRHPC